MERSQTVHKKIMIKQHYIFINRQHYIRNKLVKMIKVHL